MQPIRKELFCDVAIVGGGVSGCAAAVCAARRGLHVIMFEKCASLGGLATNGYVPSIVGNIEGICHEFTERMDAIGQLRKPDTSKNYYHKPSFEPEFGKLVLEDMVVQAGARIIYDATCIDVEMDGAEICRALFHTKGGVVNVSARIFIDSTGDADLSTAAGVPYEVGGGDFAGLNMSTTLGSRWSGADLVTYQAAEDSYREKQIANGVENPNPLVYDLEEKWIREGKLVRHVCNSINGFYRIILPNTVMENADFVTFAFHSYFCHNTDVEDISRQILEQHQLMQGFYRFLRECVPGFKNIRLVGIGSLPGVRDSRRIFGEYMLKVEDVICGTKFEDGIARFPEMMDTHHPTNDGLVFMRHFHLCNPHGSAVTIQKGCPAEMHPFGEPEGIEARPNPYDYCDIPYRCLVPKKVDNLLCVGRCCSAEFHATGAVRIVGPAMSTGHAAGVAADIAIRSNQRPRDIDGREVRRLLIEEEHVALDQPCSGFWAERREQKGEFVVNNGDAITIV